MASNRLRGITIPIGADTQELNNALRDVDRQAGSLQHELIEVNRLLRLDPGNVELLAQQQALYSDQLDNSRERLQMLRRAEEELQEQFRRGEASEEQMRSLQREIIRTEQSIQRTENAMNGLNDTTRDTAESADTLGEHFQNALKTAGTAIAAAAGAAAIASVKSMDDMTQALNQYQAATGTAAEEMTDIEDGIKRLYNNNLGENFDDIAQSMALIRQQTDLTGDELEDATRYALLMRDTFDLDVNEGIRGANALMKQFGLSAEAAYNLIAIGAQNGLNQNQDLADQLAEYSVYYAEMGFSADEMFDIMAKGAETGAFQIDYLNDAIKEFGIRSKDASDGTKGAFAKLGLDAEALTDAFAAGGESAREAFEQVTEALLELDDETAQNTIGVTLFGTKWEDIGIKGMTALMDLDDALDTSKNALAEINDIRYDSFGEALQGIGRQFQTDILIPIGEAALPALNRFADGLQWAIDNLNTIVPIAAGFAVTVGSIAVAVNAHTIASKAQTVATIAAEAATKLFNATLNANPIGIVVALIAGLITAITTLYVTNEEFHDKVNALLESIKNAVTEKLERIKALFKNAFDNVSRFFTDFSQNLKTNLTNMLNNLVSLITGFVPNFLQAGKDIFDGVWDGMQQVWTDLTGWISDKVQWMSEKLTFWRRSQAEMNQNSDGSHAKGLSYVPKDGYRAILHEGEAVLTKAEAREYREGVGRGGVQMNVTQNIYSPTDDARTEQRIAAREFRKLAIQAG